MGNAPRLIGLAALLWTLAANPSPDTRHRQHEKPTVLAPGYTALEFELPPPGSYPLPPLGTAADGPVLDEQGDAIHLHDLLGDRIVVLSFIYTSCTDVNGCPLATFVLKSVQDRLLATPELAQQVRLLSFSFDPQHDTPAVLREYSRPFRRDGADWHFLTTSSTESLAPTLEAYNQWVIPDYDTEGNYLGTMSHLLRVYLIDRDKRIRNIYSMSFLHADTVATDIQSLLTE